MPEPRIAFDQAGLGNVLKQYQLEVPPNQREYAWTEQQVTQLFEDFAKALNDDVDYFLGTIVTIPRPGGKLEVVDGQQRLATTAILLAAIRDYLAERDEAVLVESINNEFLTGIDRTRRARTPKLKLNVADNELFGYIVTGDPLPGLVHESHHRLAAAYRLAVNHVRNIVAIADERSHGDFLERWVSFIEHRALVVLLRVAADADAYKMFETLNDRGLRVSQADLIKNYLFGKSGERFQEVQGRWSFMRGALETLDDEDATITFLRHALIVQKGYLREADVYDKVQELARSEPSTVAFMSALETLANVYVASFNPENERWNDYPDKARKAIEAFALFNIKPLRPLVVAIGARMDLKEAAASLEFLVSLGVRLMIASNTRSGSVEVPLADAAAGVFSGNIDTAVALKAALSSLTPSNQEFRAACEIVRVSNARLARYYLRSLEMAAKGEADPWFVPESDRTIINLEHVLPKRPEDNWPTFSEDDVRLYATRLGNQALMRASDNSSARSAPFSEKRPIYARSPYVLTSQIADVEEWTVAAIAERQKTLADLALKAWPVK